jgi:phage terminase small subunit|tara:strand:- start:564 stop:1082 length:519 start_codon:yes stop_codon:yes gene_type:complete
VGLISIILRYGGFVKEFLTFIITFWNIKLDKCSDHSIIEYMTNKKELTTKQEAFLNHLTEVGGDPRQAAVLAGYAESSYPSVVKALKTEILDLATNILAQSAPKAAMKLVDIMDSPEPIPQANMRIQAAQTILDRVGLGKTDRLDVTVNTAGGLFILPAKQTTVIEGNYEEI